jgi:hypothetical protein
VAGRAQLITLSCLAAIVLAVPAAGCGSDQPTRLQDAIDSVGEGASPTGTGLGWVDLDALDPADIAWAAQALAPEASDVLTHHAQVREQLGFDPAAADQALSLAGSYAFGVRFWQIPPGLLEPKLRAAGAVRRQQGDWTTFDLGDQFVGRTSGPLEALGALVARDATRDGDGVVLARATQARDALTAEEGGAISGGRVGAAADCLGDVVVARLVPAPFTHNVVAAPALTAIGVEDAEGGGRRTEVLCAIDRPESEIEDRAEAIERALAPGATDPITGRPMEGLVERAEVTSSEDEDGEAVTRAEIRPPEGAPPGLLLAAFARGSLLTYLGAPRPIPRG